MRHRRPAVVVYPAFTHLELLVVGAIIALLIGILLPALGKAQNAARVTADLNNLRGLEQAQACRSRTRGGEDLPRLGRVWLMFVKKPTLGRGWALLLRGRIRG